MHADCKEIITLHISFGLINSCFFTPEIGADLHRLETETDPFLSFFWKLEKHIDETSFPAGECISRGQASSLHACIPCGWFAAWRLGELEMFNIVQCIQ